MARKVSRTYRKAIMVEDRGDGIWRTVEVYRRGTPAGPDPDRAEMLLAEGLAEHQGLDFRAAVTMASCIVADATSDEWVSAWSGATLARGGPYDRVDPDAYAAGAALAMALEDA